MPRGLVFLCLSLSLFFSHSLTVWPVRTVVAVPLRSKKGERGAGRQVGKAASRPCGPTLPRRGRRVGMHSQVGVQGVAGHCLGYVLHNACTCHTVPAPYSITPQYARPDSIYYSPLYPHRAAVLPCGLWLVCRGQHFSPSGLAGNGNDKDKAREGGRRETPGTVVQVLWSRSGTVRWYRPQEVKCLLTLQLQQYTACRAPCIRTWKVCAVHNTHTRTPSTHPLAHTFVCDDRSITALQ